MQNTEELLNKIDSDLKNMLSEKRYIHSIGVMNKAAYLAKKYGVNIDEAKLVGLTHDIAKEMPEEQMLSYASKHNITVDEFEKNQISLLHGKIGAEFCKEKYDFSEDMQNAIKYHVTGNPKMNDLAKVLYVADKTEEGREYIDFDKIAEKEEEGLNAILLYILDNSICYIIDKGQVMHVDTVLTRNHFLKLQAKLE